MPTVVQAWLHSPAVVIFACAQNERHCAVKVSLYPHAADSTVVPVQLTAGCG
jgi:hypothetical protein